MKQVAHHVQNTQEGSPGGILETYPGYLFTFPALHTALYFLFPKERKG